MNVGKVLDVLTLVFCALSVAALIASMVMQWRILRLKRRHREMLCLMLLEDFPQGRYGLDIVEASGGKLQRGHVYVVLGRLEEMGLVAKRDTEGRPLYSLTQHGVNLVRWLQREAAQ